MVKKAKTSKNNIVFRCEECSFSYESEDIAKRCEEWCKKNKSCNLEIIKHSLENKKNNINK